MGAVIRTLAALVLFGAVACGATSSSVDSELTRLAHCDTTHRLLTDETQNYVQYVSGYTGVGVYVDSLEQADSFVHDQWPKWYLPNARQRALNLRQGITTLERDLARNDCG